MSTNLAEVLIVFFLCVLIVLFAGDPDLMDAIIGYIKARS